MKRRQVLIGIVAGSLATLRVPYAQGKKHLIGLLDGGERLAWWTAFRNAMRELGYIEGKNVAYESRFARGNFRDLPAMADDLVRRRVDVIVVSSSAAAIAASQATDRIPIVTTTGGDHIARGLAKTLAEPGGNVTGVTTIAADLTGKRVEILRELFPKLSRLAVVWHSTNVGSQTTIRELEALARPGKLTLQNVGFKTPAELPETLAAAAQKKAEAVFVVLSPTVYAERHTIGALALKHRLPSMHTTSEMTEAAGLMSYGPNYPDLFRRAAVYVDKILKGAKPGSLPIEAPSTFELVINLRTAKSLGVQIPHAMLVRASRVID